MDRKDHYKDGPARQFSNKLARSPETNQSCEDCHPNGPTVDTSETQQGSKVVNQLNVGVQLGAHTTGK